MCTAPLLLKERIPLSHAALPPETDGSQAYNQKASDLTHCFCAAVVGGKGMRDSMQRRNEEEGQRERVVQFLSVQVKPHLSLVGHEAETLTALLLITALTALRPDFLASAGVEAPFLSPSESNHKK